ncbi:helix-hairpin-helix domain-containing protein [Bacillus sp. MRMR6]|uniref:helix-hairpin-helix domain-containing protein n=1 Tax=Bacillus sp. MRMR6 TaxID=1928617 RepID=UPI000951EC5A|nr:helix-hairpin-helix domain-containing protein [Bacillus sp. MRMR6]OLS39117.1 hypothetical protein BTR25_13365 [Bacillus sp. MRMR6]
MGSLSRKIKREIRPNVSHVNLKLLEQLAEDRGFNKGAAEQRKKDIESVVNLLADLEEVSGIGEKTADKIRFHVMSKFGK